MGKKADKGKAIETKAERQERLQDREFVDVTRREERELYGAELRVEALTEDLE